MINMNQYICLEKSVSKEVVRAVLLPRIVGDRVEPIIIKLKKYHPHILVSPPPAELPAVELPAVEPPAAAVAAMPPLPAAAAQPPPPATITTVAAAAAAVGAELLTPDVTAQVKEQTETQVEEEILSYEQAEPGGGGAGGG